MDPAEEIIMEIRTYSELKSKKELYINTQGIHSSCLNFVNYAK